MLAVELESSSGEKLQVAPGKTANLTIPIPSSIQQSAPASISLWYIDDHTGIWKEEGVALRNGATYIGDVKHFSFWNCDIAGPSVLFSATFKTADGLPLVYASVSIKAVDTLSGYAYGYTDSSGQVSGAIPANENLILQITDQCGKIAFSKNIGPYSSNTDLGAITITNSVSSLITIRGRLLNCNNNPVAKGYAIIYNDNITRYAEVNNNGEFSVSFIRCEGNNLNCQVLGVDESSRQQGNVANFIIASQNNNLGNIVSCGTGTEEYFNYTLDGADYSILNTMRDSSLYGYTSTLQSPTTYYTWLSGYYDADKYIQLGFTNSKANGTFNVDSLTVQGIGDKQLIIPFNISVTNFPKFSGEFYEGSFSGQFKDLMKSDTHTISGSFRIRNR